MAAPRLSNLEFRIMEVLWDRGEVSIREVCEVLEAATAGKRAPAYTTVQTTVYRMETKGIVRRVRKSGNLHLFKAAVTRESAQRTLIDELLGFFGGSGMPVMAHLIQSGKLTLDDVKEAERELQKKGKKS
ncbi:BlaI/MecI/CopY family transcriptional regulator [Terriglobus roseus]|uniref:Predicted transcriptional regulator n=1 Tax=Terriglobus roseus TaxID=392734 RepID=A0A1H4NKF8_9BACT|nr:BlaI/MecI/CopY family transcriptional regulator [Terriglobus roseus]SEB95368.1 Predicted transcriptional regulator [Terriglobus roseus]